MVKSDFAVSIATKMVISSVVALCDRLLSEDNDALYNREFLCSQGLRSAIGKGYVIIALRNNELAGILRFYPNRRISQISVYQFAVSDAYRKQGVMKAMLEFLHKQFSCPIICKCPKGSKFNGYFNSSGWEKAHVFSDLYFYWEWRYFV
jgi:predicted GNAT family acetyltransferase